MRRDTIQLKERFERIRTCTENICSRLDTEDFVVQPVEDVSPPKWHLAHTTWFFETFILSPHLKSYKIFNDKFNFLFNSYYESAGPKVIRSHRGNLTRPTVDEIFDYRAYVNKHIVQYLEEDSLSAEIGTLFELGMQHEQQHQELLLYDIKYILGNNPLFPVYIDKPRPHTADPKKLNLIQIPAGLYEVGNKTDGFCFDNELGRHKVFLHDYGIMNRLITNGEYLEFIEDGGYQQFRYWLSEGWEWVNSCDIKNPGHWHLLEGKWYQYSLNGGLKQLEVNDPVMHVSFYEADAFAKWQGKRLPTEFEWEVAAEKINAVQAESNLLETGYYEPVASVGKHHQFFGDVWEWTNSAYLPYPFYKAPEGAVGEYNGKFMVNQMVLRGGSCGTPRDHIRTSYRNFFHPHLRWMFSGIRLAQTL